MISLDDTSRCPIGVRCESCGAEGPGLTVHTVELGRLGVACLTLCPRCAEADTAPPVAVGTAVRIVGQHCAHLGITLDEMAELLTEQAEEGDR